MDCMASLFLTVLSAEVAFTLLEGSGANVTDPSLVQKLSPATEICSPITDAEL